MDTPTRFSATVAVGEARAKGTVDSRARLSITVAAIQPKVVRDVSKTRDVAKAEVAGPARRTAGVGKEVARLPGTKGIESPRAAEVMDHTARKLAAAKTGTDTTELAVAMVADAGLLLLRPGTVDAPGRIVVAVRQAAAVWNLPAAHEAARAPDAGVMQLEAAGAGIFGKSPTRRMDANPARTPPVAAMKPTVVVGARRP